MNDQELLEAAARAAGVDYGWQHIYDDYEGCTADKWDWNPLTDDGDALRLAVKLKMDVKQWESNSIAVAVWDKHATEDATQDRYNATRRAIVRAAAAIGSSHNAGAEPPEASASGNLLNRIWKRPCD